MTEPKNAPPEGPRDLASRSSPRAVWALVMVETIAFLGTEIARFGVSVYIYQATKSVYAFEALLLANTVPGLLISPLAGAIVDRTPRKRVMIGAAFVSLIGTLIVLGGAAVDKLSLLPIVLGAMLASVGEAFQWPALSASVPLMCTEEELPRFNGYLESGRAASMLAGPVIGGFLFAFLKLPGLLAVEVCTFLVATTVVATLTIPQPEKLDPEEPQASILSDSLFGVRWIWRHKPLLKFLCVAVFANFFLSIGIVLMPPYGLSVLSEQSYGIAYGLFGGGMIVGGIAYGYLSSRFRNVQIFLWTALVTGIIYTGYGFSRGVYSLAALNFMVAALMTSGDAGILTIWQLRVPEEYQGRVLSAVRMIAYSAGPVSYLCAGPIADTLAPRLFAGTGGFATFLARTWGTEKTGQVGFIFTTVGIILFIGFALALTSKDVRGVEDVPEGEAK